MITLLAESPIHAPFRITQVSGSEVDVYDAASDVADRENDVWGALKYLCDLNERKSHLTDIFSKLQLVGPVFLAITGTESSSDFKDHHVAEWSRSNFFNHALPLDVGGISWSWQVHSTGSLVKLAMAQAFEVYRSGWPELKASIDRWAKLPYDWDGVDSFPPPQKSIFAARRMLNIFSSANLPYPCGYIAGDGEIGFRWQTAKGFASLSLLEDGTELAFCRIGQAEEALCMEAAPGRLDLFPFIQAVAEIA